MSPVYTLSKRHVLALCRRQDVAQVYLIVRRCCRLIQTVRDPYRPELHYMRGPGPKWYAKHQRLSVSTVL